MIDALDDLLHNAPSIPFRSESRVDRDELVAAVNRLRAAVRHDLREPEKGRAWPLIDRFEALALAAEPVRFIGGVRVDRVPAYALLDELRERLPEDMFEQRD